MRNRKMKRLNVYIIAVIICTLILGITYSINSNSVRAKNLITEFSSEITAVDHAHGEKVNILPEEVRLWNESKQFDADYINGLYEYSDLHKQFLATINKGNESLVDIYHEADAFNPINNILRWDSSLKNVQSYMVRVAYDNKFTRCILKEENADIDKGVIIENPLVNTTYYWQVVATLSTGDKIYSPIFDFSTESSLRTITIDGVSNTRDIGGVETSLGYIEQGIVYRSARLESVTSKGLQTIKNSLGLKTDLDLRGENEIASSSVNKANPAGLDNFVTFVTPQYAYVGDLGLDVDQNTENVKNIMKVFANKENYPIVFHCAVGRDRTGTIASLLKALLGFSEQDIINDYFTSMFATTGAWEKSTTYTNKQMVLNILAYLNTFEGDTLADRVANYLISKCGMEEDEITMIRDIMTGKERVDIPAYNTFSDSDNYGDYAFVSFEKYGTERVNKIVRRGEKVEKPYEDDGFTWMKGSEIYDFNLGVEDDMTLVAIKEETYEIKIISTGAITSESFITLNKGESLDFSTLQKEGYKYTVISDEGRIITSLTADRKMTINVIYS